MRHLDVCAVAELPPGAARIVRDGPLAIGVYNLAGELRALEDRCSHDDGPLAEGELDTDAGVAVCPRHGARIDIRSGRPLTLPAVLPVATFAVTVENGRVLVELEA
ncbi:MAG TPA: non-heme iron oxygenase ferredoxin subunit [Gaiellaceae bacterium]|nr:non-heme iron oxygenase ferredoxin subunit [Gaiellaceae bacterium]